MKHFPQDPRRSKRRAAPDVSPDLDKPDVIVSGPVYSEAATVLAHLRRRLGARYSTEWLSRQLNVSVEAARELEHFWLPHISPQQFTQSIRVFGNAVGFAGERLIRLMSLPPRSHIAEKPHTAAGNAAKPVARSRMTVSKDGKNVVKSPRQAEIRIGNSDGVHTLTQRQPTIIYRKPRRSVPV